MFHFIVVTTAIFEKNNNSHVPVINDISMLASLLNVNLSTYWQLSTLWTLLEKTETNQLYCYFYLLFLKVHIGNINVYVTYSIQDTHKFWQLVLTYTCQNWTF